MPEQRTQPARPPVTAAFPPRYRQRPEVFTVLLDLVDYLLSDPRTAHLAEGGLWDVASKKITLIDHVEGDDPQAVLEKLQRHLDGEFVAERPTGDGLVWHDLITDWQGIRVKLTLAAPGVSVEQQLRERIAELEAERYRQGQLTEQHHQVWDAAAPSPSAYIAVTR